MTLNVAWLKENEKEERVRDRFVELAIDRKILEPADYHDKFRNLKIEEWLTQGEAVTDVLRVLLAEFRA